MLVSRRQDEKAGKESGTRSNGKSSFGEEGGTQSSGKSSFGEASCPAPRKDRSRAQEKKKEAGVPGEWLYLAPETVGVRQIADVLEGTCEMEIWQEAGVLEIMYGGEASMDMEEGKIHPRDQVTAAFAEEHDCDRVYLVTFSAEEYEKVLPVMRHILQECGGIFCGDTEDFKPLLAE